MSVPHLYTEEDVDYWRTKAIEREAEIDRLRHDIERMQEIDSEHLDEINHLRAENAEMREALKTISECESQLEAMNCANAILAKTAKERS